MALPEGSATRLPDREAGPVVHPERGRGGGSSSQTEHLTAESFWAKVKKAPDGCWFYGKARPDWDRRLVVWGGRLAVAARVAWELTRGKPVPAGRMLCHRCDIPSCINPDHLFVGDAKANRRDWSLKSSVWHAHKMTRHGLRLDVMLWEESRGKWYTEKQLQTMNRWLVKRGWHIHPTERGQWRIPWEEK